MILSLTLWSLIDFGWLFHEGQNACNAHKEASTAPQTVYTLEHHQALRWCKHICLPVCLTVSCVMSVVADMHLSPSNCARECESSRTQDDIENGSNRPRDTSSVPHKLWSNLFSEIEKNLFFFLLLICRNRYNNKNLHLYSVLYPVPPAQSCRILKFHSFLKTCTAARKQHQRPCKVYI